MGNSETLSLPKYIYSTYTLNLAILVNSEITNVTVCVHAIGNKCLPFPLTGIFIPQGVRKPFNWRIYLSSKAIEIPTVSAYSMRSWFNP